MKLLEYLKDKLYEILIFLFTYIILLLLLFAFKSDISLITAFSIIILILFIILLLIDYFRKRNFYRELLNNIEALDKSYLVLETISNPNFYEGKLLVQALYDINKSASENIKNYELQTTDFKEFIEMWIHEVKVPIASLILMFYNHKDKFDKKIIEQIKKIENYVEQVLYYVRKDYASKDYLIKEVELNKIISNIALRNKDSFLENKVDLIVNNTSCLVLTDSKWLEFILNQIINNSLKYKRNIKNSYIKIEVSESNKQVILTIEDNGMGIPSSDLPKVFEKSFTGKNGRVKTK